MSRPAAITQTMLIALTVAVAAGVLATGSAMAAGFTVTVKPTSTWCAPAPDGSFIVEDNDAPYFSFHCSGAFVIRGDPSGSASAGQLVSAQIDAPPGITIAGASSAGSVFNLNNGSGWVGGSFFGGGGSAWLSGTTSLNDPSFSSPYWGFTVQCAATCGGAGQITLNSISLSASESQGPSLSAVGSGNLWSQTRPGEWIWNAPGDPWPLTLAAADPSGVCTMLAAVGPSELRGPSAVPDTSQWQQCPDPTWTPSDGASVDTGDYISDAGSLPLTVSATNAAGITTFYSETLHVDDDPVSVSLSTPDDANPSVWVNHAVTVDASATAGPSGLAGANCSVDGGSTETYPSGGVTVNGSGVHNVSCTAWNNAVGPQGQPETGTSSMAVRIDETPPSLAFQPQNPSDPTGLAIDTTDGESGVAGGSIEMAPAGTNDWTSLPTSLEGSQLLANVDDAGLHGAYSFHATSCDNVGNCGTTSERLTLPLRAASDSRVSFQKIANPPRRRHRVHVTTTLRVPYGDPVTIHGLYVTAQGTPVAHQPVQIVAAPANNSSAFSQIAAVTTGADGSWTAKLPPGPSRIIRAVTDGTATILPSSGQVTTIVPARVKLLRVWPHHVPWGGTVHLVGQLLGGYLPPGGALVRLRIGYGSTYETYGVEEHVTGTGRFSTVASFGPGDPSVYRTYWFQIASLPMGNYPYAPAASQRVPVIVGGAPAGRCCRSG